MMMRKIAIAAISAIVINICATNVYAQQAISFLNLNPDPQTAALGNASTALEATAFAVWNNTAATPFAQHKLAVGTAYGLWQPHFSSNHTFSAGGYCQIGSKLGVAAAFKAFTHQAYDLSDELGQRNGSYSPKEMLASVGAAYKLIPCLALSANLGFVSSDIAPENSAKTITFDAGAFLQLNFMQIGLSATNIGPKIDYGNGNKYSQPTNLKLGAASTKAFGTDSLHNTHSITATIQGGMVMQNQALFAEAGVKYCFKQRLSAALGCHLADQTKFTPSFLSLGLGLNMKHVEINAAYLIGLKNNSPVNSSFTIGLSMIF